MESKFTLTNDDGFVFMASHFELRAKPEPSVDAESAAGFDMPAAYSAGVTAETCEEIFVEGRDRLCASIDATNAVLRDLRTFNTVSYTHL